MSLSANKTIHIDVFLGCAPMLETRLCRGLLEFGQTHQNWRFTLRNADFRYTKENLKHSQVAGVLVLVNAKTIQRSLNKMGLPWVHLLPGEHNEHPNIRADDLAIGRTGAEFFLEKGFLKCAFCGVNTKWSKARKRGFQQRLQMAERPFDFFEVPLRQADWEIDPEADSRLLVWLASLGKGVAIMAAHDILANRLVDLCLRSGLRVPQDIAILGVGNHDLLCKLSPVAISSIDAAVPEIAIHGALMLKALLSGEGPPNEVILPNGVEERRSTDMLHYGDDLVVKVVTYIRDHICEGLTTKDIVANFPLSQRTLARRFEKYVGHSPAEEIRQSRYRTSRKMITQTQLSLTKIAIACGYSDLPHMDRAYRELGGILPSKIRKMVYPKSY